MNAIGLRVIWAGDLGRQVILVEGCGLVVADADLTPCEVARTALELTLPD